MRVAYVHDWLVTYRGGEKVLATLAELYPDAPIYTLFYDPKSMPDAINRRDIRVPKVLSRLKRGRKLLLPLLPHMIESLDFSAYDLLISTSSCVAKGAIKAPHAKHICYLHSPMRYIWDQQDEYIKGVAHIPFAASAIKALTPALRRWDVASAARVDRFVVNSHFVGERTKRFYGRDSLVLAPPVELDRFMPVSPTKARGGYFLAAGALVTYKRFDLAIAACEKLGRRLIIAGAGPSEAVLRRIAGPHTEFIISPSDETFTSLLQGAEALLFPGVEDFGMIAIESMASGTPVLALRQGGALDFIIPGKTGDFFEESTADSLASLIAKFRAEAYDAQSLNQYAQRYSPRAFLDQFRQEIEALIG